MKAIELTRGKVALVDDEDYEVLSQYHWQAYRNKAGNWYAKRGINPSKKGSVEKYTLVYMHQQILDHYDGVDHLNGDGLNNQRSNLRKADQSINNQNKKKKPGTTSAYLGVSWHKQGKKWKAQVKIPKGKVTHLGLFAEEVEAARTYDQAVRALYPGYVKTNFPQQIGGSL